MKSMCQHTSDNVTTRRLRIPYDKIPPNPPLIKGGIRVPPFVKGGRGDFGCCECYLTECELE